jgi:hypothetical protein
MKGQSSAPIAARSWDDEKIPDLTGQLTRALLLYGRGVFVLGEIFAVFD